VLLVCLLASQGLAQVPQQQAKLLSPGAPLPRARALIRTLAPIRTGETPEGSRVVISADTGLDDYATYKSGDKFVVVIPNAKASNVGGGLSGRGLVNAEVEPFGDGVSVTFHLQAGSSVQVNQKFNRLEIMVAAKAQEVVPANYVVGEGESREPSRLAGTLVTAAAARPVAEIAGEPPPAVRQFDFASLLDKFKQNTEADALNLDLSPPESPAFTVLGLTPQSVVRPATPREFGSSLINSLDENGNFQTGLAIDTVPFMLFNGANVTIRDYQEQALTRLLARTAFSFAVTKGASDDDPATRLAAGLSMTLWDRGDPRIHRPGAEGDVLDCFVNKLQFNSPPIPPTATPDEVASIIAGEQTRLKPLADKCRDDGRKARWNRSSLVVAYAPSWISKNGQSSDFKWNGGAFWSSLAYGFEEYPSLSKVAQLIVHARYRSKEQTPDPDNEGQFFTRDSFFLGGRLRAGGPAFAFNFEDAFVRNKRVGGSIDSSNRFSVGAETRLGDNLYFVITAGSNVGRDDGNKGFLMSSFRFGFNRKSQFTSKP
jgi:hypothetical protein